MQTPLESYPKLADKIGVSKLFFKREDLHPYGSHKGRSIPIMIDHYYDTGDRSFAISSSGNAALAALLHTQKINKEKTIPADHIFLDIFVGNHISEKKLLKLQNELTDQSDTHIRILQKERPLQALIQSSQEGFRSLRQSTDDIALTGYNSLAQEIIESNKKEKIGAVFIGTSSGTTAQALAQYFLDNNTPIQVHIVQTSSCHPLAQEFDTYDGPDEKSVADAIVDHSAHRKSKLIKLIEQTGGYGWVATNEDINAAQDFAKEYTNIELSTNSALSIVGVMKAVITGYEIDGTVVCMICGE